MRKTPIASLAASLLLVACAGMSVSPDALFNSSWKQNECVKIADNRQRTDCLESLGPAATRDEDSTPDRSSVN